MEPRFEGTPLNLGGKEYIVPSLSAKQVKKHWPKVVEMDTTQDFPGKLDLALPVIHAALSRNYPDVSLSGLEELVDMGNFATIVKAVTGQSGITRKPVGEQEPEAEK